MDGAGNRGRRLTVTLALLGAFAAGLFSIRAAAQTRDSRFPFRFGRRDREQRSTPPAPSRMRIESGTGPRVALREAGEQNPEGPAPAPVLPDAEAPADEPAAASPGAENPAADAAAPDAAETPLFQGWPKPRATLVLTGQQYGYIEPCGCTGLANQKGGLARRHTLIEQIAERGWNPVPFDLGNQVRRLGPQAELKLQMTYAGLTELGYRAVGYGPDDLRLQSGELAALALNDNSPFLCANVSVLGVTPTHRVVPVNGMRIGVTAVLGDSFVKALPKSDDLLVRPAETALREILPKLKQENCTLYVLLSHGTVEETKELVKRVPEFHIVVTTGLGEPTLEPEQVDRIGSQIIQVGTKGMYAGVVGLFDEAPRIRYERVPLDARFADSPKMLEVMRKYQDELKRLGLAGLAVQAVRHPSQRTYAGTEACKDCHAKAYAVWEGSPHAHATDAIVHPKERGIPRHFDPECLSCHVTGWSPQKYHPYSTGYLGLEQTPAMMQSGCENCHGPAAEHVAAEEGGDAALQARLREALKLPLAKAEERCLECHDVDNSPDFHKPGAFERFWQQVRHEGKD